MTLPKAFAIDQRHLGNICSKAQLAAERCAGRQAIGTVDDDRRRCSTSRSSGPAYAVSGFGKLPARRLHPRRPGDDHARRPNRTSVKGGHLKTVVPVVPDAPIGHFRLKLFGGKKGYLVNTRDLCASPTSTTVEYTAQNGKTLTQKASTKTRLRQKRQERQAREAPSGPLKGESHRAPAALESRRVSDQTFERVGGFSIHREPQTWEKAEETDAGRCEQEAGA